MKFLRISYPDIAWHTLSIMIHVFGTCALLGYLAGMPAWTLPFSMLALLTIFYTGYYFELGFRMRRWQEFRYGGEKAPKKSFNEKLWRERRDENKENRECLYCGKTFCPLTSEQRYCGEICRQDHINEDSTFSQTLGDA